MNTNWIRRFRLLMSESSTARPIFVRQNVLYEAIYGQLNIIYIVCAFFALRSLQLVTPALDSLTPPKLVFFVKYYPEWFYMTSCWLTPVALMVAALFNRSKLASAIGLLFFIHWGGLQNIFGIADNGHRPAVWLAILLLFLPFPQNEKRRIERAKFINHYWFSILVFLLCYVLSGWWKLFWGGGYQLLSDHYGIWNYKALSYIIGEYMIKTAMDLPSATWFIDHPWVGWVPFMVAVFTEATIWAVMFRPSLWRLYGFLILMMHMGTYLTLAIGFETQFLLAGLILFTSPFYVSNPLRHMIKELPGIKLARKLFLPDR